MTDYTPEQIEWAARLLCIADGLPATSWEAIGHGAPTRFLAELERQGVKVTTSKITAAMDHEARSYDYGMPQNQWEIMHDAAKICPDAGEGET